MSRVLKVFLLLVLAQTVQIFGQEEVDPAEVEAHSRQAAEDDDGDAPEDEDPETIMKEYDTDKDGKLSVAEITADSEGDSGPDDDAMQAIKKGFATADGDGDGLISLAEI